MVRQTKYDHKAIVTLAQDNTKEVSKDEWNDGHNELGMTGHGTVTTLTIVSGSITPINDMHIIDGEGAANDNLDTIDNTETAEFDELWLYAGSQTITVRNADNIFTLSGANTSLSTTVPIKFVRRSTNWFQVESGVTSQIGNTVFGDGGDGDLTVSSGTTTLTEIKFFENVTIDSGATLSGDEPFQLFVSDTLTVNGTLSMIGKGSAGGAGGAAGSSGAGGASISDDPGPPPHPPGGSGGSGGTGGQGSEGSSGSNGITGLAGGTNGGDTAGAGGQGGPGQNSGVGPPGAGGTAQPLSGPPAPGGTLNRTYHNISRLSVEDPFAGIGAGGSGGAGTPGSGGGGSGGAGPAPTAGPSGQGGPGVTGVSGGPGGTGGGTMIIFAKTVVVSGTGIITSEGSDATNGSNGPTTVGSDGAVGPGSSGSGGGGGGGNGNGAGGGSGGNGGIISIITSNYTNNGSVSISGGTGGTGGIRNPTHPAAGLGGVSPTAPQSGDDGETLVSGTVDGSPGSNGADGLLRITIT